MRATNKKGRTEMSKMTKTEYKKKRAELKEVYKVYKEWGEACKAGFEACKAWDKTYRRMGK